MSNKLSPLLTRTLELISYCGESLSVEEAENNAGKPQFLCSRDRVALLQEEVAKLKELGEYIFPEGDSPDVTQKNINDKLKELTQSYVKVIGHCFHLSAVLSLQKAITVPDRKFIIQMEDPSKTKITKATPSQIFEFGG